MPPLEDCEQLKDAIQMKKEKMIYMQWSPGNQAGIQRSLCDVGNFKMRSHGLVGGVGELRFAVVQAI